MSRMVQVPYGNALVNRIAPAAGPQAFKTYGMAMPLKTHWRQATCEEYECDAWTHGWVSTFDLATELGQQQYHFCSHDTERSYSMQRVSMTLVKFIYKPGNRCFRSRDHRVPLERPGIFSVRPGDWRAWTGPARAHTRAEFWVEDMSGHLDQLATARERG